MTSRWESLRRPILIDPETGAAEIDLSTLLLNAKVG
jgi:hypothetical protein